MNWLRDNILKILIVIGALVLITVVLAIIFKPKGDSVVTGTKYAELETKLQSAAIKYVGNHKKLLPTTVDDVSKIKLSTLQSNNYIGKLVAIENSKVTCDGYVEISKVKEDKNDYRYTPFISCGNYYVTKVIGDYIIDAETKNGSFERYTDDGLYKMGNEYVYRGENVNNYIALDSTLYRIIKIDENNQLQLVSTTKTSASYVWDDRYNVDRKREEGINNFVKSRLYDSLEKLYNNIDTNLGEVYFSSKEKEFIIPHEYCIGKRSSTDTNIYSGTECKETIKLNVGLITLSEYSRASIDTNCNSVFARSCANYNYFSSLGNKDSYYSFMTLTGVLDNSYQVYRVRFDEIDTTKASTSEKLYPVIYINNKIIYSSGTGTYSDPYIVR